MTDFLVTIKTDAGCTLQCCYTKNTPQEVLTQLKSEEFITAEHLPEPGQRFGKLEAIERTKMDLITIEELSK